MHLLNTLLLPSPNSILLDIACQGLGVSTVSGEKDNL